MTLWIRICLTLLPLTLSAACAAQTPTVDFPAGADWPIVMRPTGSIIAGASHTNFDEFDVPMAATNGGKFLKVQTVRGAVDYLAYSGPASGSTLQNQEQIKAQLLGEGYKPVFSCTRKECNGYDFAMALVIPLLSTLNGTRYHNFVVETFGAVTDDVCYTAFQRGDESLCLLAALAPGKFSGVLLIDVGGTLPVAQKTAAEQPPATQPTGDAGTNGTPDPAAVAKGRIRSRLGALLNR